MKLTFEITPSEVFELIAGKNSAVDSFISQLGHIVDNMSPELIDKLNGIGEETARVGFVLNDEQQNSSDKE